MTHLLLQLPRRAVLSTRDVVMSVLPHGGQRAARRNAWAGMSAGAARDRSRREADVAVALADRRASLRTEAREALRGH